MSPAKIKDAPTVHDPAIVQKHLDNGAKGHAGRAIPDVPLAKHVNLTPFPSQYFQSVDQDANVFHTVALRLTYDMHKTLPDGSLAYAAKQTPLATKDEWSGTVNESSPLWESDYAPFIESAPLNLNQPFGLSLSKPCAELRTASTHSSWLMPTQ